LFGDFYGDPECAIISRGEKYLIMAGCGLIIYYLQEPFEQYLYDKSSTQYFYFFNEPSNIWSINGLRQEDIDSDLDSFRFVAANDDGEFIYKMNAKTFEIEMISNNYKSE